MTTKTLTITYENNFARVIRVPFIEKGEQLPFCFGGPQPQECKLIDWFNPCPSGTKSVDPEKLRQDMRAFVRGKAYWGQDAHYIVVCDFGLAFDV